MRGTRWRRRRARADPGQRTSGAQGVGALWGVQRVMRQRINRMHFSFYDGYSNSALNAAPYPLNGKSLAKPESWQERFGGNLGGPLRIPHVYDGRDKTFIFINVESQWNRNTLDQFSTVPTMAERDGDFSGVTYPNSTARRAIVLSGDDYDSELPGGDGDGQPARQSDDGSEPGQSDRSGAAAVLSDAHLPDLRDREFSV